MMPSSAELKYFGTMEKASDYEIVHCLGLCKSIIIKENRT